MLEKGDLKQFFGNGFFDGVGWLVTFRIFNGEIWCKMCFNLSLNYYKNSFIHLKNYYQIKNWNSAP